MNIDNYLNNNYRVLHYIDSLQSTKGCAKVTQDEIASAIGVSKLVVNKILKELEDDGCLSANGRSSYKITEDGAALIASIQKIDKACKAEKLTFIDLFAGIGGIRKGFEDENTKCVFSCEWDKYCQKTYEANYGEVPFGDITKIAEKDVPQHDVVLAGFPCQPFSMIGKRQGIDDELGRGTLFFDVLRMIRYHKPKMFLLENVTGLLTIDNGNTFKSIIMLLKEAGYSVFHDVLEATNFGLPQTRKRVIIVGFRNDLGIDSFELPKSNGAENPGIGSLLEHNPKGYSISKHLQGSYLFKKDDGLPQIVGFDSKENAKTLVASYHKIQRITGTFIRDGETGLRMFSELECKRLMGFPDDFIIPVSKTQMYHQMGNSVAVPMIKAVADKMKKVYYEKTSAE